MFKDNSGKLFTSENAFCFDSGNPDGTATVLGLTGGYELRDLELFCELLRIS